MRDDEILLETAAELTNNIVNTFNSRGITPGYGVIVLEMVRAKLLSTAYTQTLRQKAEAIRKKNTENTEAGTKPEETE